MGRWHTFSFDITRPDTEATARTWVDLFIMDQVARDVLRAEGGHVEFWRVHRRWPDPHVFQFICYTHEATAARIRDLIGRHPARVALVARGYVLDRIRMEPAESPDLAETGDGNWPPELRMAWPWFIQGVCEALLCLIDGLRPRDDPEIKPDAALKNPEAYYGEIERRLNTIWERVGSDAFLHHAHAAFGYPAFNSAVAFCQGSKTVGDSLVLRDIGDPTRVRTYRALAWGPPNWQ